MPTCPSCRARYPDGATSCTKDGDDLLPDEAFASADAELEPGRVVGEYRIEGKLGKGGFGTVYRAVHPLIGKAAAIKVLARQYSSNPQMVARFIAEARAVNQIRHRHIIDIFSFGSLDDGRQYFVMELLEGMTLDAYLKRNVRLTPEQAIPILRAVARALDAAHAREIAHRDLKPENVFLSMQDGEVFPKLLDFGIAKLMGDAAGSSGLKTNTGTPIGTPHYMSPEQCRGRDVDHRTDVYSFGIMAHELLTGKLPFHGADIMELLMKQVMEPAPPMSRVCPSLSPALDAPVLAMLEKDPARRPRTLGAAVESLSQAAREAGYDIALAPAPGESGGRIVPPPEGAADIALGPTIGATPVSGATPQTLQGTATVTFDGSRRSSRVTAYSAAGVVALGGAVVLLMFTLAPKAKDRAAFAAPQERASGEAPASVVVSATVDVQLDSTPHGARVERGSVLLGTTPLKLSLPRGGDKVPVTFKLDGFEPTDIEVVPTSNVTLDVPLRALRAPAAATPASAPSPLARPAASSAKKPAPAAKGAAGAPSGGKLEGEIPSNPFGR